jgi:uncharacterized membrane protein
MTSLVNNFSNVSLLAALIGALFATFGGYFLTFFTERRAKQRRACKEGIHQGIVSGMLQWDDLEILGHRWNQGRSDIHWILSDLLHESLSSKDENGQALYHKVKELLKTEHNTEPFAELPESIRLHVENVSSRFRENGDEVIRPLAAAICDSIVEAERKSEIQRKLTMWSFFVGIISLFIGVASLVFAISVMNPSKSRIVEAEQSGAAYVAQGAPSADP